MRIHKFSAGEAVIWIENGERRKGMITDPDVDPPSSVTDKAGSLFYRVTDEHGGNHIVSELDLEPTGKPVSPPDRG